MSRSLVLDDFLAAPPAMAAAAPAADFGAPPQPDDAMAAFDRGYKSGWDDCAKAEAEERRSVSADLAKHLAEATLTYEAARRDILSALGPFFEEMIGSLLPRIAAEAVAPAVLSELGELAGVHSSATVEIHAAPTACPMLQRFLEDHDIPDLAIKPEPAFVEGQVSLRLGEERRDIDMTAAAERIADAISGLREQIASTEAPNAVPPISQGVA